MNSRSNDRVANTVRAVVPERLRGSTRNRLGTACASSNLVDCANIDFFFVFLNPTDDDDNSTLCNHVNNNNREPISKF